jgi:hypothetical protein
MGRRDYDILMALEGHKESLARQVRRLNKLLITVDNTINHLKGKKIMNEKGLFEGFTEEEQEKYALEAEQLYDPETVRASNRKWKAYSQTKKQQILKEGKAIYTQMVGVMPQGADSIEAQGIVERWRKHMDHFWTPNLDQLVGLAEGYTNDPRFKANFDKLHPNLAEFMREAVKIYVARKKGK